MSGITVDLRGEAEVQAMLGQLQGRELQNRTRRALRAGVKPIREEMRRKGKTKGFPRKFATTRTRNHRNPLGVSVSPKSPLSPIFEHGAKTHPIGKAGQLLYGTDPPFVARGPVDHPGMAARPFIAPVFAATEDKAESEFSKALLERIAT